MDDWTMAEMKTWAERMIAKLNDSEVPDFTDITHAEVNESVERMGVDDADEYRRLYRGSFKERVADMVRTYAKNLAFEIE